MIESGGEYFGNEAHAFYSRVLPKLQPGLMLDIGAAIGGYTRLIRDNSPNSRVIAFEPFPGNWPYFEERVGVDDRVELRKCAVADKPGKANFFVSSTVNAKTGFWSQFPGSSSMGMLTDGPFKENDERSFTVNVVALDEILDEPVKFMKIDVQGAELAVLTGRQRLWRTHGIDAMSIEFSGKDTKLLEMILGRSYHIIDTMYNIIPNKQADLSEWDIFTHSSLSTGSAFVLAWPKLTPTEPAQYMEFLNSQRSKAGNCWTDLICIAKPCWEQLDLGDLTGGAP